MVSSGLLKFDDKPENYWAWKTSISDAVHHLLTLQENVTSLFSAKNVTATDISQLCIQGLLHGKLGPRHALWIKAGSRMQRLPYL